MGGPSEGRIVFVGILETVGRLSDPVVPQHVAFRHPHEVLADPRQKGRLPAWVAPVVLKGPSDRDRLFLARERDVEFARVLLFGFGRGTPEEGIDAVAGVGDDEVLEFEALGLSGSSSSELYVLPEDTFGRPNRPITDGPSDGLPEGRGAG